jgi:hypothetical protein
MSSLNLSARPLIKLPASAFPDWADVYVCDKCGRDITQHLRRRESHSWEPMGPEAYFCLCGQRYLTGAIEWDHLGDWERARRTGNMIGLGVLLSVVSCILGSVVYFALRFGLGLREAALFSFAIIAILPFLLTQIGFWPAVIASMWRTRVGSPKKHT